MRDEYVEVECEIVRLTARAALLINLDVSSTEEEWVPLSCIEENLKEDEIDSPAVLHIAQWKCDELGW